MKTIMILMLSMILLASCGGTKEQEQNTSTESIVSSIELTEAQFKNVGILMERVEKRNISTTLRLNGKIDVPPQNMVSVSMPLGGYLKSTQLLPGMHIKKGEVIATMEDQQYIQLQQDYLVAKSKLMFSENEYQRQKDLNQSKASSDKVFQQTEMEYKTQKIALSALAEKLKLIHINPETLSETNLSRTINLYSTIDGFVSKVNVNIGKYVNPTDVLFEFINPTDIHLNIKVFEKDLDKLAIGQKVMAFNNQTDKKHPCEIILISQDLSPDRTADVHCHFLDYDKTLVPGMYMNAEVEVQSKGATVIANDAIVSFEGKDYIFVNSGNRKFDMLQIKKGNVAGDVTEISSLDGKALDSYQVVSKGAYSLLMQLKNKSEE